MTYKALDVAHLILEVDPLERPMTRLRLLKLTYITHGLFLGRHHRRLIREDVEAWKHGPVIFSLYNHFMDYSGGGIIPAGEKASTHRWSDDNKEKLTADAGQFVESVAKRYAYQSGRDMSALTHQSGTPWYKTIVPFVNAGFDDLPRHLIIPADYIEDYYTKLFARYQETMSK